MAEVAMIRYPVKQPYHMSGIKNILLFTITFTLLNFKFPYFPFPIENYQARP